MMLLYMLCSLATARVSLCTCAVISMFRCNFGGVEFELSSSANSVGLLSLAPQLNHVRKQEPQEGAKRTVVGLGGSILHGGPRR